MKYLLILNLTLLTVFSVSGCDSNFTQMDGAELRKRAYSCLVETSSTAAELQVCENIRRECERRQEAGQFDC